MGFNRLASAVVAGAMGVAAFSAAASAADLMPVKAPPPPPVVALDMHAFFDISFKNAYITPRGLLVTNTGLTTQVLAGIAADVYKDKGGFINLVSVYGYTWNDIWSEQAGGTIGNWNEFDWAVGMTVKFAQDWKFGVEYVEFLSPPHNFSIERNVEFTLAYDDSKWWGNVPFAFNPYVKLFWAVSSGSSTVVTGKAGDTYDVELGIVPTLGLKKYTGIPLTISAPTWVTVGPKDYWNGGFFNNVAGTGNLGCGTAVTFCDTSGVGVFSTGLTAKLMLDWMPARFGSWYAKAGFQYYDFLNNNLQLAQTATLGLPFAQTHKDYVVGFGGIGFSF